MQENPGRSLGTQSARIPPAPRSWAVQLLSVSAESWSPWVAESGLQAHRREKHQPETKGPTNTRNNQMVKGKHRNVTNRNQGNTAPSEPNSPIASRPKYLNTSEKQELDLKSQLMMLIEDFKKYIDDSLKEIQENTGKQVEALKEETQKSLKEL